MAVPGKDALRRLNREVRDLQNNPQLVVRPSSDNMLQWHFVFHSLPADTPYCTGCYHGKIYFPNTYPHEPPSIYMSTPSGRLEINKKLCLSMSDWHPETWNPAWTVETILVGLLSFFLSDKEHGYGSIKGCSREVREKYARESWAFNARDPEFRTLFEDFLTAPSSGSGAAGAEGSQTSFATAQETPGAAATSAAAAAESSASAAPADAEAPAVPQIALDVDDEPQECWICRDTDSTEPLVQPCACRGSMSGVHASCVEDWIRNHMRNAVNDGPPRCQVCNQPYRGSERAPSFVDFVRDNCRQCWRALPSVVAIFTRIVIFAAYLNAGTIDEDQEKGALIWFQIISAVLFAVVATQKVMLLTVSLPPNRPPPRNRFLAKYFFCADPRLVIVHIYEIMWALILSTVWLSSGELRWYWWLPVLITAVVPTAKCIYASRHRWSCAACSMGRCLRATGRFVLVIAMCPLVIVSTLLAALWHNREHIIHPLAAGPHLAVVVLAFSFGLAYESNMPVFIVLVAHSLFAFLGVLESLFLQKLTWRTGFLWVILAEFVIIDASLTVSPGLEFSSGVGSSAEERSQIVQILTLLWAALLMLLAIAVNRVSIRTHMTEHYRLWQRRNGQFRLDVGSASSEPLSGASPGQDASASPPAGGGGDAS
eukprot:TRINITY_DN74111_c0_g1_i1.p1 TRINITY_DN74111_c0_g1~~TRINITY_DN74111_c0_g1_i1.p1  ORF type:complete len:654 (-),score=91.80 TRINITY_DN74111_c0_g1_i1:155-2116(-)